MSPPGASLVTVGRSGDGLRLDRWLKARHPGASFALLQRLIRTGQVRVDGRRSPAGVRLRLGQKVRIPPVGLKERRPRAVSVSAEDAEMLASRILHRDGDLLAIDKPGGLAVQGGTGVRRHLDRMLDGLRLGAPERPRLVHRLDKDTTGVLLLARSLAAARHCARAFRDGAVEKTYWALVRGRPSPASGVIERPLAKAGAGGDRRAAAVPKGRSASTAYRTRGSAKGASWVEFRPETGRTHQIRAHAAAIGCPVLGDSRYGGGRRANADPLQLHARELALPGLDGLTVRVRAPLPGAMREKFLDLGIPLPAEETERPAQAVEASDRAPAGRPGTRPPPLRGVGGSAYTPMERRGSAPGEEDAMADPVIARESPFEVTVTAGKSYAWCACGRSATQPWCDGSHKDTEWMPVVWKAEESETVYLCGCKRTGSKPLCDGTHATL